jgi:hypothetical protein
MISVEMGWGARSMKEQFPELPDDVAGHLDQDNHQLSRLRIRGLFTPAENVKIRKRFIKQVQAEVKKARTAQLKNTKIENSLVPDTVKSLFESMRAVMLEENLKLIIDFDSGEDGLQIRTRYEGSNMEVHPALNSAAVRLLPHLVSCNAEDWDETTAASGRVLWRPKDGPFLDMDDQTNDWSHESYIETDMLEDATFEEYPSPSL